MQQPAATVVRQQQLLAPSQAVPYFFDDDPVEGGLDAASSYLGWQADSIAPELMAHQDIASRLARIEQMLTHLIDAPGRPRGRRSAAVAVTSAAVDTTTTTTTASAAPKAAPQKAPSKAKAMSKVACTNCRRCHEACSRETPCQRCSEKSLACTYRARLPWAARKEILFEEGERRKRVESNGVTKNKNRGRDKKNKKGKKIRAKRKEANSSDE